MTDLDTLEKRYARTVTRLFEQDPTRVRGSLQITTDEDLSAADLATCVSVALDRDLPDGLDAACFLYDHLAFFPDDTPTGPELDVTAVAGAEALPVTVWVLTIYCRGASVVSAHVSEQSARQALLAYAGDEVADAIGRPEADRLSDDALLAQWQGLDGGMYTLEETPLVGA